MSWKDREYGHEPWLERGAATWGLRRPPKAAFALMIIHAAAFLLVLLLRSENGAHSVPLILLDATRSWTAILLHPLACSRFFSVLFVVLALWSLGGRLEARIGATRLTSLYLVGNLVAGGAFFAIAAWRPALAALPLDYPAGALAALCVAAWWHLRHEPMNVFGYETSPARVYAICAAITIVMTVLGALPGAPAWLVAVAAGGASAYPAERLPQFIRAPRGRRRRAPRPTRPTAVSPRAADQPDIDDVLAKISQFGMNALTPEDHARLEAARQAKLRRRK